MKLLATATRRRLEEAPQGSQRRTDVDELAERYAELTHTFAVRPSDRVLRTLDVVLSATGLFLSAPVQLAALAAVRATGKPALYRGERVGRGGRLFIMYKIRTLRPDAETRLGPYLGDELSQLTHSEVTRIGTVLRATKADELPQLWNVLIGDMSLVGPRPIRPAFFLELAAEIPAYWQRLVVRPGLSGLAQLRMTRETSWADKLSHDFEFIADRSVSLYLEVILSTAWLLLTDPITWRAREMRIP